MFEDSPTAKKFTCGKIKCTKMVTNVLAPAFIKKFIADLENKPFSIGTDASNKGNVKTFPLVVRYFDRHVGICTKLLSFYSLQGETSIEIATSLKYEINFATL